MCLTDPTTAPKSTQLLQKLVFGAVDGIPLCGRNSEAANDRAYHSPEKHTIAPKARFRGCGRNSTSSQWQILPQPRKANNCAKSSFSGLWTEFHKQPMTDPSTAPKRKELLQKLVVGAVDEILKAANEIQNALVRSGHSPEKQRIAPKACFRGCGPNSKSNASIGHVLDRSYHSSEKHTIAPKARFRGCGRNSTSSQWQILPQPRQRRNCFKSSFSGLWTECHKQPMTDSTTAPKSKQLLQKLVFGAVDGIPQAANDRSFHSPEKPSIAPKARCRGCGRNSKSSQWIQNVLVRSCHSPEKQRIAPNVCFRGCGRNSKSNASIGHVLDRFYHSPAKHTIAPKARFRGCGRTSTSSKWQILPQPRKAFNCSKSIQKLLFGD